jgi:hypothetical protein
MAHFAQVNEENIVTQVIVIDNGILINPQTNTEEENRGIAFCKEIFGQNTDWVQTSYSGKFRGCYAGINYLYDSNSDTFVPPSSALLSSFFELSSYVENPFFI